MLSQNDIALLLGVRLMALRCTVLGEALSYTLQQKHDLHSRVKWRAISVFSVRVTLSPRSLLKSNDGESQRKYRKAVKGVVARWMQRARCFIFTPVKFRKWLSGASRTWCGRWLLRLQGREGTQHTGLQYSSAAD